MKKPPLETKVVKAILEFLNSRGGFWMKIHGSPFQVAGIPDIIGCYRGRFIAFEVKRSAEERPTKLQVYQMKKITQAGGVARVIFTVDQAEALINRINELQEARARDRNSPPRAGQ
jgi:Holliday junction resolvase